MTRWVKAGLLAAVGFCIALAIVGGAVTSGRAGNPGAEVTLDITSSPPTVTPGHVVTYDLTAHNNGTSNLSHFMITAPSAGSTGLAYVATSRPDICTAPSTPATVPAQDGITCSFGAFPAGTEAMTVSLAFSVPADFSDSSVSFFATADYSGGSNNTNSTRTNSVIGSVTSNVGTGPDLTTAFVVSAVGDTLATAPVADGLSPDNPQNASATVAANAAPGFGVVGTVQDLPGDLTGCGAGYSCWGQSEKVTFVDSSGNDVTLSTPGTLLIRTDTTEMPPGVNKNNILWFHDGQLLPSCKGLSSVPTTGCVQTVQKLGDNDLLTTIFARHHGHYIP
jgi:hypothetical protein